jgi:hypothetical protein
MAEHDRVVISHLWCEGGQWRLSMTFDNEVMDQLRASGRARLSVQDGRGITFELQGDFPPSDQLGLVQLKIDEVGR